MRAKYLFLLLTTGLATAASAQVVPAGKDTVMKGATIEVVQAYKPEVKQAPKPDWVPQLPPPDTTHKQVNYNDVPQQSLYYTYSSMPLHPLALGKDAQQLPYRDYIKLGAGNLNTIYVDAGIGALHGSNYETAIHLHHLSQKGSIANQQSSLSGVEAEAMIHGDQSDWHIALDGEQNQYYNYGYRHDSFTYNASDVRQTYTTVRAGVDMSNKLTGTNKFFYHPAVDATLYTAKLNTSETNFRFDLPLSYQIEKKLDLQFGVSGAITNLKTDTVSSSNNYVAARAGFGFDGNTFTGHALLGYALGKDSKNYFLPDIVAALKIHNTSTSIFAGVQTTLRQNTYQQLTAENPYISNMYTVQQTSRSEYFGGVQGGVSDHFTYLAKVSYLDYQNLPAFLNYWADMKQFLVTYYKTDVTALAFEISGRYTEAHKWSVGLTADIYRFNDGAQNSYVVNEPNTKISGDFRIMPTPKLSFTAYLAMQGGIHAQDSKGNIEILKTSFDVGGSGEYQIIPRLSVFLQVNNLLNNKYERWLGYQAYGFNVYGGLRLKF